MSSAKRVHFFLQCYNHRPWLEQSIETALQQRGDGAEVVVEVIDDGSTDGSRELLERLAERGGFTYLPQENRGLSASIIEQLNRCDADFVAFQATDDYWAPQKLERQLRYFEQHPELPALFSRALSVDEQGDPHPDRSQLFMRKVGERVSFEQIFSRQVGLCGASALIRREAISTPPPLQPETIAEDFALWLDITQQHGAVGVLDEPLAYYRIHGSNLHHNILPLAHDILQTLARYSDHPDYSAARNSWNSSYFSMLAVDDKREALRYLFHHPTLTADTLKGVLKLAIPPGVWKRWKPL